MRRPNLKPYLLLILAASLFYAPLLANPGLLLARGNDLTEFFWPVFSFVRQQILINHTPPFWNNLFFSGTPLLPDPQSPLFYLPNAIFLFLPMGVGFLSSFILHSIIGGMGAYCCARFGLRFSKLASLFCGILYMVTPRLAGYLEAGHFGLVTSWAWIPFAILASYKLAKSAKIVWSLLLGISLAAIFYTHLLTFLIVVVSTSLLWLFLTLERGPRHNFYTPQRSFMYMVLSSFVTFGLIAIALLPQLEWKDHTTRFLLLENRDVYPKWNSLGELFITIFWPWRNIWQIDTEKWLPLGTATTILALLGFTKLRKQLQLVVALSAIFILLLVLNNISPIFPFLMSQDWYVTLRVSTRIWPLITITAVFLSGYGLQHLLKTRGRTLAVAVAVITIAEALSLSWLRITKPVLTSDGQAPSEIYQFLAADKDKFRVFCLTRCLSQKLAAEYNLELVEGYNTLQQLNYYKHMWQLTGSYWNYYTLVLPPIGTYKFGELKPDAKSLGEFNTKYVISPYALVDKNFILEKQLGEYYIYRNSLAQPRAYFWTDDQKPGIAAKVISYSPNQIRVDTSSSATTRLVLSEVWSPGWKAYLNGKEKVMVQEKPNTLRLVDIKPNTQFVDFKYQPDSFKVGRLISFVTLLSLFVYGLLRWKNNVSFSGPPN